MEDSKRIFHAEGFNQFDETWGHFGGGMVGTVLFVDNWDILLQKRSPSDENPVSQAIDIAYNKKTVGEDYSGMKTLHDKQRIIGFTRILSPERFSKAKNIQDFIRG